MFTDRRPTVRPRLETFPVVESDGTLWHAQRQPLGRGIYRTPDDPTTLEEFIDVRIGTQREQETLTEA